MPMQPAHAAHRGRNLANPFDDAAVRFRLRMQRTAEFVGLRARATGVPVALATSANGRLHGITPIPSLSHSGSIALFLAIQQVHVILHRHEAGPAVLFGNVQCFENCHAYIDDAPIGVLPAFRDVVQRFHGFFDWRRVIPAVDLIQIDVVTRRRRLASISRRGSPCATGPYRSHRHACVWTLVASTISSWRPCPSARGRQSLHWCRRNKRWPYRS